MMIASIMGDAQDFEKQRLKHRIDAAKTFVDLLPIMEMINMDLSVLQNHIKELIDSMDAATARSTAFKLLPMGMVPADIIQNICSFDHVPEHQFVSKEFKKCFDDSMDAATARSTAFK